MTQATKEDIIRIEKKQDSFSESVLKSLASLNKAVSKIDVFQAEVNSLKENIVRIEIDQKEVRQLALDNKSEIDKSSSMAEEYKWIKKGIVGFLITAFCLTAFSQYQIIDSAEKTNKATINAMTEQSNAMKDIAKALKKRELDNQGKGK